LEKIEIKLYTLIHTKTHMNAYKKTNKMDEDAFVAEKFVEIIAYKNRLTEAKKDGEYWDEKQAADSISWRLRSIEASRDKSIANGVLVQAGLEALGWEVEGEPEYYGKAAELAAELEDTFGKGV